MVKISRSAFFTMLAASGAFVLTGCGSGTPKNSNYTGAYRSAYTISSLNETGEFDFTIDVKGRVQGTLNNQNGKIREFSGELKNSGEIDGDTFDRTSNVRGRLSGKFAGEGADATSITGGNFTLTEANVPAVGTFVVGGTPSPIPSPTVSTFNASYNGTYSIPELGESGNLSFSVDTQGKMLGFFNESTTAPVGALVGTVTNSGNFTGTLSYSDQTLPKYKQRTISGVLANSVASDGRIVGNFIQTVATASGATQQYSGNCELQIPANQPVSDYRGSFSSAFADTFVVKSGGVPPVGVVPASGHIELDIDQEGSGIATIDGVTSVNGVDVRTQSVIYFQINNDGRVVGTINGIPITGKASKQIIPLRPGINGAADETSPGITGVLSFTISGQVYLASFFGAGGVTTT